MKDALSILFSFKGRSPRGEFWLLTIGLGVVFGGLVVLGSMIVASIVGGARANELGWVADVVRAGGQLLILWPTLALLTKRGHDRNRPAAFTIGLWLLNMVLSVAFTVLGLGELEFLRAIAYGIYLLVDYGIMEGTRGPNRYGPSPHGFGSKTPPLQFSEAEPAGGSTTPVV